MTAMYGQEVYEISERDRIVAEVEAKLAEINRWIHGQDYSEEVMAALRAKYRDKSEDMQAMARALTGQQNSMFLSGLNSLQHRQYEQAIGGAAGAGVVSALGSNVRSLFG